MKAFIEHLKTPLALITIFIGLLLIIANYAWKKHNFEYDEDIEKHYIREVQESRIKHGEAYEKETL